MKALQRPGHRKRFLKDSSENVAMCQRNEWDSQICLPCLIVVWKLQFNTLNTKKLTVALGLSRSLLGPLPFSREKRKVGARKRRGSPCKGVVEGHPMLLICRVKVFQSEVAPAGLAAFWMLLTAGAVRSSSCQGRSPCTCQCLLPLGYSGFALRLSSNRMRVLSQRSLS